METLIKDVDIDELRETARYAAVQAEDRQHDETWRTQANWTSGMMTRFKAQFRLSPVTPIESRWMPRKTSTGCTSCRSNRST